MVLKLYPSTILMNKPSKVVVLYGIHPKEASAYVLADGLREIVDAPIIDATNRKLSRSRFYCKTLKDNNASYIIDLHQAFDDGNNYSEIMTMDKNILKTAMEMEITSNMSLIHVNDDTVIREYYGGIRKGCRDGTFYLTKSKTMSILFNTWKKHGLDKKMITVELLGSDKFLIEAVAPNIERLINHLKA